MEINVNEIIVEGRIRRGYGNLDSLERSIHQVGVLQPIGITAAKILIFGGRRLQAAKNLGLEVIPCRVFDIDASDPVMALRMEREENEHRMDLTASEKVELAKQIEGRLAGRQGQRTDLQPPQNLGEVKSPKERESADIAAKAVGWNRESYRQAKHVVESGEENIIKDMDSGVKSVKEAYDVVKRTPNSRTFKITLYKNPHDDAEILLIKGGRDYCTKLGLALLKAAGHKVEE